MRPRMVRVQRCWVRQPPRTIRAAVIGMSTANVYGLGIEGIGGTTGYGVFGTGNGLGMGIFGNLIAGVGVFGTSSRIFSHSTDANIAAGIQGESGDAVGV